MARPDASAKLAATQPQKGPSKILIGAVVAVVIILVGGIAWLRTDPFASPEATGPKGSIAGGKGVVAYPGKAKEGAPVVDVFEDFQCPYCGQLESANGKAMDAMAAKGEIKLVVHSMSFLDENLGNDSSKKAANAAMAAADVGAFPAYRAAVFAAQPDKEGTGFTDEVLQKAADEAGIKGKARTTFNEAVKDGTYLDYVEDIQKAANDAGVNGTPQVRINGEPVSEEQMRMLLEQPGSFAAVLAEAK